MPTLESHSTVETSIFPGEDCAFGDSALYVDLVPSTSWSRNVRSALTRRDWKLVRAAVLDRAGGHCEICRSAPADTRELHAHERWAFDADSSLQALRRLLCLCRRCHGATHYGAALLHFPDFDAFGHLQRLNAWTETQTREHILAALSLWRERSRITWSIDMTIISNAGFAVRSHS